MAGKLTVVVGAMGSGKTDRLADDYRELLDDGKNVVVFKPRKDTREGELFVKSRSGKRVPSMAIQRIDDIYYFEDPHDSFDVILIDEVQFFTEEDVYEALLSLLLIGTDIRVYGLDLTSEGETFGQMGSLLAHADEVIKLESKCSRCDNPARISHYTGDDKEGEIKVGDLDVYEPLCRECYYLDVVGEDQLEKIIEPEVEQETLLVFHFVGEDFGVELAVLESDLEKAGYTREQANDINSFEGVQNLLKDLGYEVT